MLGSRRQEIEIAAILQGLFCSEALRVGFPRGRGVSSVPGWVCELPWALCSQRQGPGAGPRSLRAHTSGRILLNQQEPLRRSRLPLSQRLLPLGPHSVVVLLS